MKNPVRLTVIVASSLAVVACSRNVVIRTTPGADSGFMAPSQKCEPEPAGCTVDPVQDTARFNDTGGTTFFVMPDCAYGVNSLLIENADSSRPTVRALCNAPKPSMPEGGIPTTTTSGGISATSGER